MTSEESSPNEGYHQWKEVIRDGDNDTFDDYSGSGLLDYDLTGVFAKGVNLESGLATGASDGTIVRMYPVTRSDGGIDYIFNAPASQIWGLLKSRAGNVYTFDQKAASITGSGNNRDVAWSSMGITDGEAVEINGFNYSPWNYTGTPAWQNTYVSLFPVDDIYAFHMPLLTPNGNDHPVLIFDDTNEKFGYDYPRIHT